LPYRVFGKIVSPSGEKQVYLIRDNRLVAAARDLDLGEGFRIDSLSDTVIGIIYGPLGERFTLAIPQAPR